MYRQALVFRVIPMRLCKYPGFIFKFLAGIPAESRERRSFAVTYFYNHRARDSWARAVEC